MKSDATPTPSETKPLARVGNPLAARKGVLELLKETPEVFDFFQAVRYLDARFFREGFPPTGYAETRAGEPFHFGQRPFLFFPPRTIDAYIDQRVDFARFGTVRMGGAERIRPTLFVFFFGLLGPNAPLPLHLTEYAIQRERERDHQFETFVNLLSHPFLSLYYRAWADSRLETSLDRNDLRRPIRFLGALAGRPPLKSSADDTPQGIGNGAAKVKPLSNPWEWNQLFYSGHWASRTRHAEGLNSILSHHFGSQARVLPFIGSWLVLPDSDRTRLGLGSPGLGGATLLGTKVWDCQSRVRIRMGPLDLKKFNRLLPGTPGAARLKSIVQDYLGLELKWDLQLVLNKRKVGRTRLDGSGRLGYSTFLISNPLKADVETVIFDL